MKQKLNAKDFILIGILTALMWIICMIISTIMSVAGPVTNVFYAGRLQRKNRCSIERIGTVGLSGKTPSIAFRRSKTTGYHWSGNRKGQPRNLLRRAHQRLGL